MECPGPEGRSRRCEPHRRDRHSWFIYVPRSPCRGIAFTTIMAVSGTTDSAEKALIPNQRLGHSTVMPILCTATRRETPWVETPAYASDSLLMRTRSTL